MGHFYWTALVLCLFTLEFTSPQCQECSKTCRPLSGIKHWNAGTLSILCNSSNPTLEDFFQTANLTSVKSLSVRASSIEEINFSRLNNVTQLDLSENDLTEFDFTNFTQLISLNLSYNYFQNFNGAFSQLTALDMSHNSIESVTETNFKFKKIRHLNLSFNSITSITDFSSETVQNLDFSFNRLQTFQFGTCTELSYLSLSSNNISVLDTDAFKMFPKLEVLNLSDNLIEDLKEGTFKTPNLLKLNLKGNILVRLAQGCFEGLNRLQYLDLSDNKIVSLSPGVLQDLPGLVRLMVSGNRELNRGSQDLGLVLVTRRLQYVVAAATDQTKIPSSLTRSVRSLDLTSNHIESVQCGDMDSYPLLTSLTLADNNLSYIEDDAFGRLELLSTLILDRNSLRAVPHTLPRNLTKLSLSHNNIKQLSPSDFSGIAQLSFLDISYNRLRNISEGAFSQLKNLQHFNVSNNPIKILSTASFVGMVRLKSLDLSNIKELTPNDENFYFPLPESNRLQSLNLRNSEPLANRLLNDVAALKALKQLVYLDLAENNITQIKEESITLLPRLSVLELQGNDLNCSSLQWLHNWLNATRIADCISTVEVQPQEYFETTSQLPETTQQTTRATTTQKIIESFSSINIININKTELKTDKEEYITVTDNVQTEYDIMSNDIWDNSSKVGVVYAFSSEIPTSHPGLFVLLLVPIALISAVLIINYSRLVQARRRQRCQMDSEIEINDFSNELW